MILKDRPAPTADRGCARWARRGWLGLQILVSPWIAIIGASLLWLGGSPAWLRICGAGMLGIGLATTVGMVQRVRARPPEPSVVTCDEVATTVIVRERTVFAAGMTILAACSLTCAGWALLALSYGNLGWALTPAATAVWLGSAVAQAAAGRYTTGGLWLTPQGLRYRSRGLQTTVEWDGIGMVLDEVSRGYVVFRSLPGAVLRHEFRAGPWHGEKVAAPDIGILRTEGLALGPVALARVVDHYAHRPQARREIGTPASLATIAALSHST